MWQTRLTDNMSAWCMCSKESGLINCPDKGTSLEFRSQS